MRIDFSVLTKGKVRNLCGPGQGFKARDILQLDVADLDEANYPHKVTAPDELLVISTRFVVELFGKSVQRAKTRKEFLRRYDLSDLDEDLQEQIENGIDSVIIRQSHGDVDAARSALTA